MAKEHEATQAQDLNKSLTSSERAEPYYLPTLEAAADFIKVISVEEIVEALVRCNMQEEGGLDLTVLERFVEALGSDKEDMSILQKKHEDLMQKAIDAHKVYMAKEDKFNL